MKNIDKRGLLTYNGINNTKKSVYYAFTGINRYIEKTRKGKGEERMKVRKAVIPAAGYGTRFLPITKGVPKEMLPLVDKPALQYIVEEAIGAGITDIVIVVSKGKQAIENYFGNNPLYDGMKDRSRLESIDRILDTAKISFVLQEPMRGNGDAVLVTEKAIGDEPFAVMFGDDVIYSENKPVVGQLCDAFEKTGKAIIGVQRTDAETASRCGVIKKGKTDGRLTEVLDIIEKPPIDDLPSDLVSLGRFVLPPEIFSELRNAPIFKNEIYLTVALRNLMQKRGGYAYEFEGRRYDLGNKLGFCQANVEFALRSSLVGAEFRDYIKELGAKL